MHTDMSHTHDTHRHVTHTDTCDRHVTLTHVTHTDTCDTHTHIHMSTFILIYTHTHTPIRKSILTQT